MLKIIKYNILFIFLLMNITVYGMKYNKIKMKKDIIIDMKWSRRNTDTFKIEEKVGFENFGSEYGFPRSFTVDKSGNIFILDITKRCIKKYNKNGNYLLSFGELGIGERTQSYYDMYDCGVDINNNLYVLIGNYSTKIFKLQKFSDNGVFSWEHNLNYPSIKMYVSPFGNCYIDDNVIIDNIKWFSTIKKINKDGELGVLPYGKYIENYKGEVIKSARFGSGPLKEKFVKFKKYKKIQAFRINKNNLNKIKKFTKQRREKEYGKIKEKIKNIFKEKPEKIIKVDLTYDITPDILGMDYKNRLYLLEKKMKPHDEKLYKDFYTGAKPIDFFYLNHFIRIVDIENKKVEVVKIDNIKTLTGGGTGHMVVVDYWGNIYQMQCTKKKIQIIKWTRK